MSKDAKEALRLIAKVLNNPRLEPIDGDRLRKARRELKELARSGKMERRKLFRIVRTVSEILQRML